MRKFWQGKKIVITGAPGFVGSNAVDFFLKKGAVVTAVIHPSTEKRRLEINLGQNIKKAKSIKLDLLDPVGTLNAFKNNAYVLHFAAVDGSLQYKNTHSADMFSKNMRINLNVLEAIKELKTQLLFVSTSDIYDPGVSIITEKSPIGISWEHKIDGYKLAKWTSELAAREFVRQYELKIVIVRPSNLYGPRDEFVDQERMRFIPTVITKTLKEEKPVEFWGDGKQERTYLFVEDFLDICSKLFENQVFNFPINTASKKKISLKDLADTIMKVSGNKQKVVLDKSKPGGAKVRAFDTSLLREKIGGFEETPLEKGIRKTVEFFKKHYL